MYYWVVFMDENGKWAQSGPYPTESRAQNWADTNVTSRKVDIVQSKSSVWSRARGEVARQLTEAHKDANFINRRYNSNLAKTKVEKSEKAEYRGRLRKASGRRRR